MHSHQVCLLKSNCLLIGTTIPALLLHASTSPYTKLHHSKCSGSLNIPGRRATSSLCAEAGLPVEVVLDMVIRPVLCTTSVSTRKPICAPYCCRPKIVMAYLVLGTTTTHGQLGLKHKELNLLILCWMQCATSWLGTPLRRPGPQLLMN